MARCYSAAMVRRQPPLPSIWLLSDARNDARLEQALARLPRGSGFVFRHYHLDAAARRARFERLAGIARRWGHLVVLSGSAREASRWRADGCYCAPRKLHPGAGRGLGRLGRTSGRSALQPFPSGRTRPGPAPGSRGVRGSNRGRGRGSLLMLVTAHSLRELGMARHLGADAILLSPVFATRSHPKARTLGPLRFSLLAARAGLPVIALGGMDARRAKRLRAGRWAAIDGLLARDS